MTDTDISRLLRAGDEVVLDGLRHAAESDGDRLFLTAEETGARLTYGELDHLVRRGANGLRRLGLGRGDRVCVFSRRPVPSAITMFASWRGGYVYCPVNYHLSGPTLAFQLADAKPAVVICQADLLPLLAEVHEALDDGCAIVVNNEGSGEHGVIERRLTNGRRQVLDWADLLDGPDDEPGVTRSPTDIANIFYTSGTTGNPKGVVQPYRWMNQYTLFSRSLLTRDDVIYIDLPLYHIGGAIFMVARAAWSGAAVGLWERFSSSDFWRRIASVGATTTTLLDVMIPWLMSAPPSDTDRHNTLNKVHLQPLPAYHHELAKRFGIEWVITGFGQTESGVVSFAAIDEAGGNAGTPDELRRGHGRDDLRQILASLGLLVVDGRVGHARGFAGRPLPYMDVGVVDDADKPVPRGEPGHLVVRGKHSGLLFSEYFGQPEATIEANRHHWFHTGDIAYLDDEACLHFVDRSGDRIRTRGENVSSAQVEDLLNQMPSVAISAVLPVPSSDGLEHDIAAFVVPADGVSPNEADIAGWIDRTIPKFMRPKHLRVVPSLPRTATNKVQKYQLREALVAELNRARADGETRPS